MAKKVIKNVKMQIPAGKATPAPPTGAILGQAGVNISEFVNQFNERTRDMGGDIVSVKLTVYEDRTFDFIVKGSPASHMIKKMLGITSGSGKNAQKKVGTLSKAQVKEIAEKKMADLNARDVEAASKIIEGTARSMGVDVK